MLSFVRLLVFDNCQLLVPFELLFAVAAAMVDAIVVTEYVTALLYFIADLCIVCMLINP